MTFADLLASSRPGDGLKDWNKPVPVFLNIAKDISAGPKPYHSGSVLDHLCRCMNEVAGNPLAVWMALAHDSGKLLTPAHMLPHHYGHEQRGAVLAPLWAAQLELGKEYAKAGAMAARFHMRAGRYEILRPGKKKLLLELFPPKGSGIPFWKMVNADCREDIHARALKDFESNAFARIQSAALK